MFSMRSGLGCSPSVVITSITSSVLMEPSPSLSNIANATRSSTTWYMKSAHICHAKTNRSIGLTGYLKSQQLLLFVFAFFRRNYQHNFQLEMKKNTWLLANYNGKRNCKNPYLFISFWSTIQIHDTCISFSCLVVNYNHIQYLHLKHRPSM